MTVWVYGASFAHLVDGEEEQWTRRIARILNTDLRSFALTGSSLEFVYKEFNSTRHLIKENDIILLSLTNTERRWFFKEKPHWTILKENSAIEQHRRYLSNTNIQEIYFLNFMYNAHNLTKKLNLHTILLINYPDLTTILRNKQFPFFTIAKGELFDISWNEIDNDCPDKKTTEWISKYDPRLNHFCKSNHIILADKIIDNIKNKIPIDLTQGFIKNIVNNYNLTDQSSIKDEFFNDAAEYKIRQIPWTVSISEISKYE